MHLKLATIVPGRDAYHPYFIRFREIHEVAQGHVAPTLKGGGVGIGAWVGGWLQRSLTYLLILPSHTVTAIRPHQWDSPSSQVHHFSPSFLPSLSFSWTELGWGGVLAQNLD